jgi:hypothetical protein
MSNTTETKPTDLQKVGILAGALIQVITGLRNGNVKAKAMTIMDPEAENYDIVSLEDVLWKALNKCGIKEAGK